MSCATVLSALHEAISSSHRLACCRRVAGSKPCAKRPGGLPNLAPGDSTDCQFANPRTELRMGIRELAWARIEIWIPRDPHDAESGRLEHQGGIWCFGFTKKEGGLTLKKRPRAPKTSCCRPSARIRATRPNHVWSLDFVSDQLADDRRFRALTVVDIFTRESLAIETGPGLQVPMSYAC